jgi:hypothetical protein
MNKTVIIDTNTMAPYQQSNPVELFIHHVMQGMQCWLDAGMVAAKAIELNPAFIDEVCDKCPDITPEVVKRFQMIGLKKLHPQLAISESAGVRRLRKMPYALQVKHVKEPVELLIKTESGHEVLKVDVRNLTPDQAAQVFDEEGIRTAAAQRAYIEDKAAKKVAPPAQANLPYRVVGKKLVIVHPCSLDRKEIANLLAEME